MTSGERSPADENVGESDETPHSDETTVGDGATSEVPAIGESPDTRRSAATDDQTLLRRFLNDQDGPLMIIREILSSVAVVLAIGLLLFAISGVWPPLVAIESPSMEPNMVKGDLVLVTEPGKYAPDEAVSGTGVVTYERGTEADYQTFGMPGSVIVFDPPDRAGSPIIHRAHFHVEEGENWYDRADQDAMSADSCEELATCPAPHDGFITKGDNNRWYDQDYARNGIAPVVDEQWVTGVARIRVPYLGWIRLLFSGEADLFSGTTGVPSGPPRGIVLVAGGVSGLVARRAAS